MSIASSSTLVPPLATPHVKLRPAELWSLVAIIGLTGLFRLFASGGDLWMGEVSAWQVARHVTNPLQLLTSQAAQVDQNHPLNTLFMYLLGDQSFWAIYRLFSLATGIATVLLVSRMMLRFGKTAAIVATVLVGCSYPLLTYSSDASGYAPMVFFALLAFSALQKPAHESSGRDLVIFNVACILGMLSHVCFIQFYVAILIYSIYMRASQAQATHSPGRSLAAYHVAPFVFLVLYVLVFVRHMPHVTGPAASTLISILSALALTIGGMADVMPFTAYLAVVTVVAFLASLDWIRSRRPELLVWYLLILIVGPAVQLLLIRRPPPASPGYFLIPLTFGILLFSIRLGAMLHGSNRERFIAIGMTAVMAGGNIAQIARYMAENSKHYSDAMFYMGRHTDDALVTITARSTDPNDLAQFQDMLSFYARTLPEDKKLGLEQVPDNLPAPQWLVVKSRRVGGPAPELNKIALDVGPNGATYIFDHEFPYYGINGSSWQVYKLQLNR